MISKVSMSRFSSLQVLGLILVSGCACIAEEPVPPPQPPYIQLTERAAWTVTLRYGDEKPTKESADSAVSAEKGISRLYRIDSKKVDELKHDLFYFSDGHQEEVWYTGRYRIVPTTDGKEAFMLDSAAMESGGLPGDLQFSGSVPAASWMAAELYRGVKTQNQIQCYYFEGTSLPGNPKAWIGVKTRLPVQIQFNGVTYTFEFKQAPAGELIMPDMYRQARERFEQLEKSRRLMRQAAVSNP